MKNTVIVILLVLVLGLGGFIVYDKFIINHSKKNITTDCISSVDNNDLPKEDKQCDDYVKNFYQNLKNNRTVLNDYDNGINIVLDKEGNVYYSGASGKIFGEEGSYSIDGYQAGIDEKTNQMSNVLKGYKLNVSDVVMFFHGITGNGGWEEYFFVKSDGSVAQLTYDLDYKTKKASVVNFEDNVSRYKNIVGIQTASGFDAHSYKLIDIYGNYH